MPDNPPRLHTSMQLLTRPGLLLVALGLMILSCSNEAGDAAEADGRSGAASSKADRGQISDVEWANQFFLTQIFDARWNPEGVATDDDSNNCGPASLAMLMASKEMLSAELSPEQAIDHARAMMHPSYPEIDADQLAEGASLYREQELIFLDDDGRPVYFDLVEDAPSIPQGIQHGGAAPVFGYSWSELEALLQAYGAVIAYGHISDAWRSRFSGEYGGVGSGAIPHFILLLAATNAEDFLVSDPMHRGGALLMDRGQLQSFFKSPVNAFETSIRLVAWGDPTEPEVGSPDEASAAE